MIKLKELPRRRNYYRLRNFNYSSKASYFITIVTSKRIKLFGEISANGMELSTIGYLVEKGIHNIQLIHKGVVVDEYSILPEHIHLLISIENEIDINQEEISYYKISKIIQGFKTFVTKQASQKSIYTRKIWRRSFHDRVVRNNEEYFRIKNYIKFNALHHYEKETDGAFSEFLELYKELEDTF